MGGVREKGVNICESALFTIMGGWATLQVEMKTMEEMRTRERKRERNEAKHRALHRSNIREKTKKTISQDWHIPL